MSLLQATICPNAAIIKLKHYFDVESSVAGSIISIMLQLLERQNVKKYKNYESAGSEYLLQCCYN